MNRIDSPVQPLIWLLQTRRTPTSVLLPQAVAAATDIAAILVRSAVNEPHSDVTCCENVSSPQDVAAQIARRDIT